MQRFVKRRFPVLALVVLAVIAGFGPDETEAHKWVTSRYTYNDDIFQILRDRCGHCHVEGGPAPMGLMTWNDGPNSTVPWGASIRQLVIDEQMPPWYADPTGPAVRGGRGLSAIESDKLLTWVTGGTPQGNPDAVLPEVKYRSAWSGGPPDVEVPMETEYTMAAGTREEAKEFSIATSLSEPRWLKAVDLLPGAPAIVRNALISLEGGPVLAVWVPGDDLVAAPSGAAFRLPAGAKLRIEIHYKKQWQTEGQAITDRSTVGLYFTDPPISGRPIGSLAVAPPAVSENDSEQSFEPFTGELSSNSRVVALRPSLDRVYGSLSIEAVTPAGTRVPLLKLRMPRPEWRRRYWLAAPADLPAGTRIEVTRTPPPAHVDLVGADVMKTYPLQVALEFVPLD